MVVCTHCKHENQPHFRFCLGCGRELPRSASTPEPAWSPPVHGESRCGYCGLRLPDAKAARCPHCNAPL